MDSCLAAVKETCNFSGRPQGGPSAALERMRCQGASLGSFGARTAWGIALSQAKGFLRPKTSAKPVLSVSPQPVPTVHSGRDLGNGAVLRVLVSPLQLTLVGDGLDKTAC